MDLELRMSNMNSCRLCALSNDDYLNIFSEIGIELQMREIISEHFKCDVNDSHIRLNNYSIQFVSFH